MLDEKIKPRVNIFASNLANMYFTQAVGFFFFFGVVVDVAFLSSLQLAVEVDGCCSFSNSFSCFFKKMCGSKQKKTLKNTVMTAFNDIMH